MHTRASGRAGLDYPAPVRGYVHAPNDPHQARAPMHVAAHGQRLEASARDTLTGTRDIVATLALYSLYRNSIQSRVPVIQVSLVYL